MTKMKVHTRAHIRLNNQAEVLSFIQELCRNDDSFSIENKQGVHRINAKSVIGVMYMGGNVSCHDETFTIVPQTAAFLKVQHNQ